MQLACGPNAIRSLALSTALGRVSQHRSHIADFMERENGFIGSASQSSSIRALRLGEALGATQTYEEQQMRAQSLFA